MLNKIVYTARDLESKFMELCKDGKKREGFSTGYFCLDDYMKLAPGYMSIVSGIPSMGKSEFVDAVAINMAIRHDWRWCFFSPENFPIEEHMAKLAEKYIGKRLDYFTVMDRKVAVEWLSKYFFWLYPEEEEQLTFKSLLSLVMEVNETQGGINGFVFDPWNEITHENKNLRDDQYLSSALRDLRRFARSQNLHAIIVAHPNRTIKVGEVYTPPTLYDLNGGAMWYNKADYGWVVHRHSWDIHEITVYIQKVKFKWMGKKGDVSLDYDPMSGRFKCKRDPEFTLPSIEPQIDLPAF